MARQRTAQKGGGGRRRPKSNNGPARSDYFVQPGKRGSVVVLRKPCGNRITPKVCGVMPSAQHAKMLIAQLQKAESVVGDLFLEATDDGIEALEAVLAACRDDVLKRLPVRDRGPQQDRGRRPDRQRGGSPGERIESGTPEYEPPASPEPLEVPTEPEQVSTEPDSDEPDEAAPASKKRPARKRSAPRKRPSE